jgi:hypothetical protein
MLKFEKLTVSESTHMHNSKLAHNLLNRASLGIFDSMQELVGLALKAYPDEELAAGLLLKCSESMFLKTLTSPLHAHIDLCNNIFLHLLESTDFEYHRALGRAILKLLDALYIELKKGG